MNILGINCFSHDTSACLLVDGEVIAFAEEERFNKEKHTRAFPYNAIDFCLSEGNTSINDLDYVGFPFKPGLDYWRGFIDFLKGIPLSSRRFAGQTYFDYSLIKKVVDFKKRYGYRNKILFVGHHEAHAASSFYVSPFDKAAILSIDRGGDYLSTLLARGEGNRTEVLKRIKNPHSLGSLYTVVTAYLGFKPNSDEGKVMGLAPYGRPTYLQNFREIVRLNEGGEFKIDLSYFTYHILGGYGVSPKFLKLFGQAREPESEIHERHEDIAWALQKVTEEAALHLANHLHSITGEKNLCVAGGVGLNSVMNAAFLRESPFEHIFIQPAANDAGTSLGCALYIWHMLLGRERNYAMEHAYYGPEFSNDEIERTLENHGVPYSYVENPAKAGAELVARGKIVGWFQGRMEVGPRALGNRSILADPRDPNMKDILNRKVKHRESFRPFAPSVLEEYAEDYFDDYYPSPFMLLVLPIKGDRKGMIPAVCHVDGTGRLQTVTGEENPLYWELINEFKKITGIPLVVNTSFNVRGQPIVMSPQDALECYLSTQLDCLIMGNYLLEKD
ncbi:MAG: carbamoyltransferase [Actinomycetota bacterium]|nr:carbamoyltransferase [Actinomycetota bacterium]